MRCLLSVDTGGTKCQTIAVREDGTVVGLGRCGFSGNGNCAQGDGEAMPDPHVQAGAPAPTGGTGRTMQSVSSAIRQALQGVDCSELHVVSYYRYHLLDKMLGSVCSAEVVHHPVHEHQGVLELAGLKYGVIVSSGTGAFVHVVGKDGGHLHLDSLGPILGDYGSAYHIGALAVQAAARSDWHPRHKTSLRPAVHRSLGIEETRDKGVSLVGVFDRIKDRAAIADLARVVDEEAMAGDTVALRVLDEAARSLAETVYDAYDALSLRDQDYTLVGTGGVIEGSDIYWDFLCRRVREFAPDLKLTRTDLPHVVGVALCVLPEIADGNACAARARLMSSAREIFRSNAKECSE